MNNTTASGDEKATESATEIAAAIASEWVDSIESAAQLHASFLNTKIENLTCNMEHEGKVSIKANVRKILSQDTEHLQNHHAASSAHIFQPKVLRQRHHLTCGYHSLHNAILCLKALNSGPKESQHYLRMLEDRACFWFSFHRMKQTLMQRVKERNTNSYPWSVGDVDEGCMEREYMLYLIENYEEAKSLGSSSCFTSLPELNSKALRHCFYMNQTIENITSILAKFHTNEPIKHAFLIGCRNHWFTLIVNKYKCSQSPDFVHEFTYLDSRNTRVLGVSSESLIEQVKERFAEKVSRSKKGFSEREEAEYLRSYLNSLKETIYSIKLLTDCILQRKQFITECLDLGVSHLMKSYNKHVINKQEAKNAIHDLTEWCFEYYHPATIKDSVMRLLQGFGISNVSKEVANQFIDWTNTELTKYQELLEQHKVATVTTVPLEEKHVRTTGRFMKILQAVQLLFHNEQQKGSNEQTQAISQAYFTNE